MPGIKEMIENYVTKQRTIKNVERAPEGSQENWSQVSLPSPMIPELIFLLWASSR